MNSAKKTPGYNCRLAIGFAYDKNGNKWAFYCGGPCVGMARKIKMSLAAAELFIAQDQADQVN